jgi:hypothetical protein
MVSGRRAERARACYRCERGKRPGDRAEPGAKGVVVVGLGSARVSGRRGGGCELRGQGKLLRVIWLGKTMDLG